MLSLSTGPSSSKSLNLVHDHYLGIEIVLINFIFTITQIKTLCLSRNTSLMPYLQWMFILAMNKITTVTEFTQHFTFLIVLLNVLLISISLTEWRVGQLDLVIVTLHFFVVWLPYFCLLYFGLLSSVFCYLWYAFC